MKSLTYSFKQLLSGGLFCCLILLAAYLFRLLFPAMHGDTFSSSICFLMWLILFVGALLWAFHAKGGRASFSRILDWQFITAFILVIANQTYIIMSKEFHTELAPLWADYAFPVLVVVGIMVTGTIKISIALCRRMAVERRRATLLTQKMQQILNSPPAEQKGVSFLRMLIENKSIAQFSAGDYLLLVEGCQIIDPVFFVWLKNKGCQLPSRDIVLCVLIRMHKTKEEILTIFCISDGSYRTMRSRARKRLEIEDTDMETFLHML